MEIVILMFCTQKTYDGQDNRRKTDSTLRAVYVYR